MTHRPLSATAGAVATALAALLSGCSGGGGTGSTAPALGPVPVITDPAQVTLPTDAYLPTAEQIRGQRQAAEAVTIACMHGFGFSGRTDTFLLGAEQEVRNHGIHSSAYGCFGPAGTQSKGYEGGTKSPRTWTR